MPDKLSVEDCISRLGLKNYRTPDARKRGRPVFKRKEVQDYHKQIGRVVDDVFSRGRDFIRAESNTNPNFLRDEAQRMLADSDFGLKIWGRGDRDHILEVGTGNYTRDLFWDNESDRDIIIETTRLWLKRSVMNKVKNDYPKRPSGPSMMEEDDARVDDDPDTDNTGRLPLSNPNANSFMAPPAPMYPQGSRAHHGESNQPIDNASYPSDTAENMSPPYHVDDMNDPDYFPGRGMSMQPGYRGTGRSPKRKRASETKTPNRRTKKPANNDSVRNSRTAEEPSLAVPSSSSAPKAADEDPPAGPSSATSVEAVDHVGDFRKGQNCFAPTDELDDHDSGLDYPAFSGLPVDAQQSIDHDDLDSVIPDIDFSQEQILDAPSRGQELDDQEAEAADPGTPQQRTPPTVATARPSSFESIKMLKMLRDILQEKRPSSDVLTKLDPRMSNANIEDMDGTTAHSRAYNHWIEMHRELASFQDVTGYKGLVGDDWTRYLGSIIDNWDSKWATALPAMENLGRWTRQVQTEGNWIDEDNLNEALAAYFSTALQVLGCTSESLLKGFEQYNHELLTWFIETARV
ncbi:hypothetical protein K491DRAFT_782905 [Lophiostoma macrostomum CBS 122681]|uniref:Uncharacterized protein n=1 Tax=Lophiostoma macrostomum CBS 122681 TaxID=1314788 RepID=A0A6A6SQC5_9PLEO|nr:hypothetical protein K491DRAFT_782905 [Lophiostoma macrostomum CBS 122681]